MEIFWVVPGAESTKWAKYLNLIIKQVSLFLPYPWIYPQKVFHPVSTTWFIYMIPCFGITPIVLLCPLLSISAQASPTSFLRLASSEACQNGCSKAVFKTDERLYATRPEDAGGVEMQTLGANTKFLWVMQQHWLGHRSRHQAFLEWQRIQWWANISRPGQVQWRVVQKPANYLLERPSSIAIGAKVRLCGWRGHSVCLGVAELTVGDRKLGNKGTQFPLFEVAFWASRSRFNVYKPVATMTNAPIHVQISGSWPNTTKP